MTDRELLELAAKAAGIEYDKETTEKDYKYGLWLTIHGDPYEGQRRSWNPLIKDSDAFRLAVTLNMCVTSFTDGKMAGFVIGSHGYEVNEENDGDPLAATRRVIVRAAAEIGMALS